MVGVPGKFKGCNTCRSRRVKCDNLRPDCQKCKDSGRTCGGYTRETIFIVGTVTDQGRCSSHPHRTQLVGKPKGTSPTPTPKIGIPRPVQVEHEFGSTIVNIADAPSNTVQCSALHANFSVLVPMQEARQEFFTLPTLNHRLPDPSNLSNDGEFSLNAACLFHFGTSKGDNSRGSDSGSSESSSSRRSSSTDAEPDARVDKAGYPVMLFVYEQTTSAFGDFGTFKHVMGGSSTVIKQRGCASFQRFPDHHFFARIYRPAAIFHAMSRCKKTFLADPQWCSTPWEEIPQTDMDTLLNIQVLLPGIFERAKRLEEFPPSLSRSLKAKDLLANCERIDKMFSGWYNELCERSEDSPFWPCQPTAQSDWRRNNDWKPRDSLQGLSNVEFEFIDAQMALVHMYYWTGLCLLYQTMKAVHQISVEPLPSPSPPPPIRYSAVTSAGYSPQSSPPFASHRLPGDNTQQPIANQSHVFNQGGFPFAQSPNYPPDQSYFQPISQAFSHATPQTFAPIAQPYFHPEQNYFYNGTQPPPQPLGPPFHSVNYQPIYVHGTPSPPQMSVPSTSRTATPTPPSVAASFSAETKFSNSAIVTLAQNICQAVPYTLRNIIDTLGPDHLSWPLSNAQQAYRRSGPEFEIEASWCGHVMEILRNEGWLMSNQMGSKSWKEFKSVHV